MISWWALGSTFGLGFAYFIAAIPAGRGLGLPVALAALVAALGYSCGAVVVLLAGEPLRRWWERRAAARPPRPSARPPLWRRAWDHGGLWLLGLAAPVTLGPQLTALAALGLGEKPFRIWLAITLGALPWAVVFSFATEMGFRLVP
jgi:hypothetical protein